MNRILKFLPALALMTTAIAQDGPSTMSEADKAKIIESLKTMQDANAARKKQLITAGIAALMPASANENDSMALFEKCLKKKEYDDNENRKDKDWREWRTNNKDNLASAVNKRAVRYQIRWALITLKAALEPKETYDPANYAGQAIALMTEILQDTKVLTEARAPYNSSVLNGPIGQLYELTSCRPDGWPDNIMDPTRVIESLVLEPARKKNDIAALRRGWGSAISMQKVRMEAMAAAAAQGPPNMGGADRRGGGPRRMGSDNMEAALSMMEWRCETECYQLGDEATAASKMMSIINRTKDPRRKEMLIAGLVSLLEGKKEDERGNRRNNFDPMARGGNAPGGMGPGATGGPVASAAGTAARGGASTATTSGARSTATTTDSNGTSATSNGATSTRSTRTATRPGTSTTTTRRAASVEEVTE